MSRQRTGRGTEPAGTKPSSVGTGRVRFDQLVPSLWARLGIYFAFWTFLGLINAGSSVIDASQEDPPVPAWEPVTWELSSLYIIGLACPFLVRFTLRFPWRRDNWLSRLSIHLPAMVLFSLVHTWGMVFLRKIAYGMAGRTYAFGDRSGLWVEMLYEFYKDIGVYWIIVGLTLGFEYYNKYRERELRASQLQTQLAQARLENLLGQLNPHFLFNSLNMISSYMYENVAAADRMISRLSDLLRATLNNSHRLEVRLGEELEILEMYLEIMQARFQDKLKVEVSVGSESRDAMVPNLVLQPLVENALRHGIAKRPDGGRIDVSARTAGDRLRLLVVDDGPGLPEGTARMIKGHGLTNIEERLRNMYRNQAKLELESPESGGFKATVEIPLRPAASDRSPQP